MYNGFKGLLKVMGFVHCGSAFEAPMHYCTMAVRLILIEYSEKPWYSL